MRAVPKRRRHCGIENGFGEGGTCEGFVWCFGYGPLRRQSKDASWRGTRLVYGWGHLQIAPFLWTSHEPGGARRVLCFISFDPSIKLER